MTLIDSLLTAILRADGDALVLHVGESPYVVARTGQTELSKRTMTLEATQGMLNQLLPAGYQRASREFGAVEHDLPPFAAAAGDRFTVVAAWGGEDVWIEIRRHRRPTAAAPAVPPVPEPEPVAEVPPAAAPEPIAAPTEPVAQPEPLAVQPPEPAPPVIAGKSSAVEPPPLVETPAVILSQARGPTPAPPSQARGPTPAPLSQARVPPPAPPSQARVPTPAPTSHAQAPTPAPEERPPVEAPPPVEERPLDEERAEPTRPAVVVPLTRPAVRPEPVPAPAVPPALIIDDLLHIAAARGATALYLTSGTRPTVRVEGEVRALDGQPVLSASDIERLMLDLLPDRDREAVRRGASAEWLWELPDLGRIRCQSFRDHRGPGAVFRLIPSKVVSAVELGLDREARALTSEPEGLVLVAAPRASGKSTLLAALVDGINRSRSDHVISLEAEIQVAHESQMALVSQREIRGDATAWLDAARAALRENPDVLVVDELRGGELAALVIEAAQSGRLVIATVSAATAQAAVERMVEKVPSAERARLQGMLAEGFRGAIAQILLRKVGGGRVAARELLLGTRTVTSLIAAGELDRLAAAMENGRKAGMSPLVDALVALVEGGQVHIREAFRHAGDREAFVERLKAQGVDTSQIERFA